MRAVVLTSSMRRHCYVANRMAERLDVAGVWQEEKSFAPLRYATSPDDERIITDHFAARDVSEERFFAADDAVTAADHVTHVAAGGCNDPLQIERIRAMQPDVILVFGTSLLKPPLIETFAGRILNIHLGLSPYYRGAGTNFWPLVNDEPEYCGATIHFLDAGVDSGPIIAHARPDVIAGDGPHEIGNKTIVAATAALSSAALALRDGTFTGVPQLPGGRVYRRADFSAAAVLQLYRNFENGMIERYLAERAARDARLTLVTIGSSGSPPVVARDEEQAGRGRAIT